MFYALGSGLVKNQSGLAVAGVRRLVHVHTTIVERIL